MTPLPSSFPRAIALATGLLLAGCDHDHSVQAAAPAARPPAKIVSGPLRSVPMDFPADVHLPAVAYTVDHVVRIGPSIQVTLHSSQSKTSLYSEYVIAMKSSGWQEATSLQPKPAEAVLSYQKGNRLLTVSLVARPDSSDAGTDISLQVEPRKPGG